MNGTMRGGPSENPTGTVKPAVTNEMGKGLSTVLF